jgi:type I restriction enzyme R subunit
MPPIASEPTEPGDEEKPRKDKAVIKLRDGKLRAVSASLKSSTMFIGPTGTPISAEEFIGMLYDTLSLPEYFADEDQLRELWSDPVSRRVLLNRLAEAGFAEQDLEVIMKLIEAENSDLYDVLEFVAYAKVPISRVERVLASRPEMQAALSSNQRDFIDFVLDRYMSTGVEELDADKLPDLIKLKYNALQDGLEVLGGPEQARAAFVGFQKYLYLAG